MKKIIIGSIILGFLVIASIVAIVVTNKRETLQVPETISVVYVNKDGSQAPAVFDNKAGTVTITTPKTGTVTLKQAVSGSGARYASDDESIVVWDKGGSVTVEQNNEVVYTGTADESQTVASETMVDAPVIDTYFGASLEQNDTPASDDNAPVTSGGSEENVVTNGPVLALTGDVWVWEKTVMNDDSVTKPNKEGDFKITFTKDGRVQGDTDCNNFGGSYSLSGSKITFGPLMSTLMYCEGAIENEFVKQFGEVDQILFDDNGNLVLLIKYDSGSMMFKKQ